MNGKHFIWATLFSAVLLTVAVIPLSGQVGTYDPWYDLNDDGKIDGKDIARVAKGFGTLGTPITKASIEYDSGWINITDKRGQYFTITPNFNLETTNWFPCIYGKVGADLLPHQKYWYGYEMPGWNNKTYGGAGDEMGYSVVETNDGGYALAGTTYSYDTDDQDFWLVKTDALGNMVWNKTYGGTGWDYGYSVVQTGDGGYAFAGFTPSFGAGYVDFWLVKTDAFGNMEWNKTYGGAGDDYARSLVLTADGGYALAGFTNSFGAGSVDFYLVKTDSAGIMQWNRTYGGASNDLALSVVQTNDGGYALAGTTYSYGVGYNDFWLVKTNSTGIMQWNRTYGNSITLDTAYSLVLTGDGGYALAGRLCHHPGTNDFWLVKTDSAGNVQWNRTYGGAVSDNIVQSLVYTGDGKYVLAGYTNSFGAGSADVWLVKADSDGNMMWNRTYGGVNGDTACSMIETSNGGYAIVGRTTAINSDMLLVKTDVHGLTDLSFDLGVAIYNITADAITFYRGKIDPYYNYIRVCLWVLKENP